MTTITFIHPDNSARKHQCRDRRQCHACRARRMASMRSWPNAAAMPCAPPAMSMSTRPGSTRLPPMRADEDDLLDGTASRAAAEQPVVLPDQDHARAGRPRAAPAGATNLNCNDSPAQRTTERQNSEGTRHEEPEWDVALALACLADRRARRDLRQCGAGRRAQRHLRHFPGHQRHGFGRSRAHGRGGFQRRRQEHQGRDRLRRPPEQGRRRLGDRAQMARGRQGRRHRRRAQFGGRAHHQFAAARHAG